VRGILVPGFRKCGTSTVYSWLMRLRAGSGNENYKEPQYFCNSLWQTDAARRWYERIYAQGDQSLPILDGSTLLMGDPEALVRAKLHFRDGLRVLILIRDPAHRSHSAYWHMRGQARHESRSWSAVFAPYSRASTAGIFALEQQLIEEATEKQKINANYLGTNYLREVQAAECDFHYPDAAWCHRYLGESLYSRHIPHVAAVVPQHDLMVVAFEQLMIDRSLQQRVAEFCGADLIASIDEVGNANPTYDRRGSIDVSRMTNNRVSRFASDLLPKSLKGAIKNMLFRRAPPITHEQYLHLREVLNDEYEYWERMGIDVGRYWSFRAPTVKS